MGSYVAAARPILDQNLYIPSSPSKTHFKLRLKSKKWIHESIQSDLEPSWNLNVLKSVHNICKLFWNQVSLIDRYLIDILKSILKHELHVDLLKNIVRTVLEFRCLDFPG